MVRLVYLNCPATLYSGPSPTERQYPRLTNRVVVEEVGDPPPSLEVCSYVYYTVIVCVQILFWGIFFVFDTTNVFNAWDKNDRVT